MTSFNYQGPNQDGRQYDFTNDAGARFSAYVPDSLKDMLQSMAPGTRIDADIQSKTSKSGSQYTQITSINGQRGQRKQGAGQGGGGRQYSYDPRRFVESVVCECIKAGLIKDKESLDAWTGGAYAAIQRVQTSAIKGEMSGNGSSPPSTQPAPPATPGEPLNDPIPF